MKKYGKILFSRNQTNLPVGVSQLSTEHSTWIKLCDGSIYLWKSLQCRKFVQHMNCSQVSCELPAHNLQCSQTAFHHIAHVFLL